MAKRAPSDEQPYRPLLDQTLVSGALTTSVSSPPQSMAPVQPPLQPKVRDFPGWEVRSHHEPPIGYREAIDPPVGQGRKSLAPQAFAEKLDQEKRILFTRQECQAIDRLVTSLATRLNAQVKVSHVMRALATLLLNAEGEVDRRAGEMGALVRPPNGDAKALQRFEREIAGIIGAALRDARPLK